MTSNSETANLCGLNRKDFQTTINGKKTDLYILRNRKGYEVAISNSGVDICAIMVPDREGTVANVIQGFDSILGVFRCLVLLNTCYKSERQLPDAGESEQNRY